MAGAEGIGTGWLWFEPAADRGVAGDGGADETGTHAPGDKGSETGLSASISISRLIDTCSQSLLEDKCEPRDGVASADAVLEIG